MKSNTVILEKLKTQTKESPLRQTNLDLRNSPYGYNQRMLNAIETDSPLPVHQHLSTSETVVCLRGKLSEIF
jgi:cupin fold WbuC family metalloprotein